MYKLKQNATQNSDLRFINIGIPRDRSLPT
jgi:hypothetical protein